ncbi:brct domain-containing protein [Pochonia chlamydosporia 170]|uniref:Brct domain-containing protein n=1 Tax=Pochonia chlamydosporia 170 TaxID=1380566 RepID=A0A179FST2_METCM|nr:brct domain-containing protein [Pochonia chlamydosporia 170]OAQ68079.1 brct domain-containing protein [Pochonia chlamydosporia 170]
MPRGSLNNVSHIFKRVVMAAAGPLPVQNTIEQFKNWARQRKGVFLDTFDESVTHLLCSKEQFEAHGPIIKHALKSGCYIVDYDWFLLAMGGGHESRRPEYYHNLRIEYDKKKEDERKMKRLEDGKRLGERFIDPNLYHVYVDDLLFPYEIELTRFVPETGHVEKHTLYLYESNARPHLYWFGAKFSKRKGDSRPHYHLETEYPTTYDIQLSALKQYFEKKTGIEYEERLVRFATRPADKFQYTPPMRGKSTGRYKLFSRDYCFELNRALRGLSPEEDVVDNRAQGTTDTQDEGVGYDMSDALEGQFTDVMDVSSTDDQGNNEMEVIEADTPMTEFDTDDEEMDADCK